MSRVVLRAYISVPTYAIVCCFRFGEGYFVITTRSLSCCMWSNGWRRSQICYRRWHKHPRRQNNLEWRACAACSRLLKLIAGVVDLFSDALPSMLSSYVHKVSAIPLIFVENSKLYSFQGLFIDKNKSDCFHRWSCCRAPWNRWAKYISHSAVKEPLHHSNYGNVYRCDVVFQILRQPFEPFTRWFKEWQNQISFRGNNEQKDITAMRQFSHYKHLAGKRLK